MDYSASELRQLKKAIKSKRRERLRVGVLFFKDSAPVDTAQVTVVEAANCGFELLFLSPLLGRHSSIWLLPVS